MNSLGFSVVLILSHDELTSIEFITFFFNWVNGMTKLLVIFINKPRMCDLTKTHANTWLTC